MIKDSIKELVDIFAKDLFMFALIIFAVWQIGFVWWWGGDELAPPDVSIERQENKCTFVTSGFRYKVTVKKLEWNPDGLGKWENLTNTLFLYHKGVNLNVVAHEVSHAVDSMLAQYQTDDPHLRAYAQGYLTECVYNVATELNKK